VSAIDKTMIVLAAMIAAGLAFAQAGGGRMTGYSKPAAARQKEVEERFKQIPSAEKARSLHRYLTAEPHPAGSERNNELARSLAKQFEEQGWEDVKIRQYDVLVSGPREIRVEMLSPVHYVAGLREDAYEVDPDTANPRVSCGYAALSASGEVTAPVVYAYSGNPEDYALLRKHGIDPRGKIALVRYSNPYSYRGFKALTAQQEGAAALLIYSDPMEDGYVKGKVFPDGPWGPESHIQRGAITYDFLVAGDPLTPGWPSLPGARRLKPDEAISLPKIMAVPMSWRDAKPILENMGGPVAPAGWQGGLKIKYRLGGEAARLHVKVDMNTRLAPNYVVEARIRGEQLPDEWVLIGNHRDAWEFGGVDPSSGTASMMEVTRALGELKNRGLRPKRTIVACSWDGEEVGLTGSTEWGEQFAEELKTKLVAYLNVDSSTSGPDFEPSAVASLAPLIVDVTRTIQHPSGGTLYSTWKQQRQKPPGGGKPPATDNDLVDVRIGSGSDHTVFLNHLGRPTVGLTFDGPYGVYHSVYDDFYWMNHFGDPGYRYHVLLAQVWGVLALRLANAEILPFDFAYYADCTGQFIQEVGAKKGVARHLDLSGLEAANLEFHAAGLELRRAVNASLASGAPGDAALAAVNRRIMDVESNWMNPDGIPGRPWFKHLLYAARYTYAHLELPGLTEAVEKEDWATARQQARLLQEAISRNAAMIREAAAVLQTNPRKPAKAGK
jgi:N-acetylated-alpha-linked acidic dipeptidase